MTPTFVGTATDGITVQLFVDDTDSPVASAAVSGSSYSLTLPELSSGGHIAWARLTDTAGGLSTFSVPVAFFIDPATLPVPNAPTLDPGSDTGTIGDGATSVHRPVILGTTKPSSTVQVYDGTIVLGEVTADMSGDFSFTPAADLAYGLHQVSVCQVDVAGNVSEASEPLLLTILTVNRMPLDYVQRFDGVIPDVDEGWLLSSSNEGRITVADGMLRMDDSIDGGNYSLNEAVLHLDIGGRTQAWLEVDCTESGDETHLDGLTTGDVFAGHRNADIISVSADDGSTWTVVHTLETSGHAMVVLHDFVDLSATETLLIKFQQYDNYAWPTDGWAFDNIEVYADDAIVVGRQVFYNHSAWDGNDAGASAADDAAIATDKQALLPGQTATFANYTSYSRGINGIMVDIDGLGGTPTASDFVFKSGNSNDPSTWTTAPAPLSITVRPGEGAGDSDRVTIIWADNDLDGVADPNEAVAKQRLQVTVLSDANGGSLGLADDDVFYFGNAIGETGNYATNAIVNASDEIAARNNPAFFPPATITNVYDFDRNKIVNATDQILARNNVTFFDALKLISVPAAAGGAEAMVMSLSLASESIVMATNSDEPEPAVASAPETQTLEVAPTAVATEELVVLLADSLAFDDSGMGSDTLVAASAAPVKPALSSTLMLASPEPMLSFDSFETSRTPVSVLDVATVDTTSPARAVASAKAAMPVLPGPWRPASNAARREMPGMPERSVEKDGFWSSRWWRGGGALDLLQDSEGEDLLVDVLELVPAARAK